MDIQHNSTKKIAIFVEGLTEFIFISHFIQIITNYTATIKELELYANKYRNSHVGGINFNNPASAVEFLIIKVGNDEQVLAAIKERANKLGKEGYNIILGLRDMYSESYKKQSSNKVDPNTTKKFIEGAKKTIEDMGLAQLQIDIFFSIMEIEAWFLAMWEIFEKINSTHTRSYIENKLGINLSNLEGYFQPSKEIKKIITDYKKKEGQIKKIVSQVDNIIIDNVIDEKRCQAYNCFISKMKSLIDI